VISIDQLKLLGKQGDINKSTKITRKQGDINKSTKITRKTIL